MSKRNTITYLPLTAPERSVPASLGGLGRSLASHTSKLSCRRIILLLACWALASTPASSVTVQFSMRGYVYDLTSASATLQRENGGNVNVGSLIFYGSCQGYPYT